MYEDPQPFFVHNHPIVLPLRRCQVFEKCRHGCPRLLICAVAVGRVCRVASMIQGPMSACCELVYLHPAITHVPSQFGCSGNTPSASAIV